MTDSKPRKNPYANQVRSSVRKTIPYNKYTVDLLQRVTNLDIKIIICILAKNNCFDASGRNKKLPNYNSTFFEIVDVFLEKLWYCTNVDASFFQIKSDLLPPLSNLLESYERRIDLDYYLLHKDDPVEVVEEFDYDEYYSRERESGEDNNFG